MFLYGHEKPSVAVVQRNVDWKFGGLISYCVISWDYLCVFTDRGV